MPGPSRRTIDAVGKRVIDLVGSILGLMLVSPLLSLAIVAIKATMGGPIFFAQERTGRGGQPFRVFKLRTMDGAPAFEVGKETGSDDPRITPIGRWLRRSGCDELPQLINVLRGEMSLVGPRPLLAWENELCDDRQATRLRVRPGITGLAQVSGRNAIPRADRLELDALYVERASVGLDLIILLRTIPVALFGLDAYAPGHRKGPGRGLRCDLSGDRGGRFGPFFGKVRDNNPALTSKTS